MLSLRLFYKAKKKQSTSVNNTEMNISPQTWGVQDFPAQSSSWATDKFEDPWELRFTYEHANMACCHAL